MEEYLKVGIITASHGVHGEMKVYPTTDDPARFKKCKTLYLLRKGVRELKKVASVRFSGEFVLLKLEGIETPEEVHTLRQSELYVDRAHAVPLEEDEYYIADLIGMEVYDESGALLGTLRDVLATGANDVYQIDLTDGRELLLPAIHSCVLEVHPEENRMKVHVLPGLLEEP